MEQTMTLLPDWNRWKCGGCGFEEFPRDYETEHLDGEKLNNKKEKQDDNQ